MKTLLPVYTLQKKKVWIIRFTISKFKVILALSTRIRILLNPYTFLSGYAFHPCTRIRWIRPANPETFESALQSRNFWIRYCFGYVWTVESENFRIRWRCMIGSSLYSHLNCVATKQHGSLTKMFFCFC